MKKIFALLAVMILSVGTICARDRVTSDVNVLPTAAKTILSRHFSKIAVNHIRIDSDVFGKDYDVVLNDGTEIDFDKDGNVKEIDCGNRPVPEELLLKPVRDYVAKNFKGQKIVGLEVDKTNYEVRLSTGTELRFDRSGQFQRIDD